MPAQAVPTSRGPGSRWSRDSTMGAWQHSDPFKAGGLGLTVGDAVVELQSRSVYARPHRVFDRADAGVACRSTSPTSVHPLADFAVELLERHVSAVVVVPGLTVRRNVRGHLQSLEGIQIFLADEHSRHLSVACECHTLATVGNTSDNVREFSTELSAGDMTLDCAHEYREYLVYTRRARPTRLRRSGSRRTRNSGARLSA